ncbi:MAG: hypothetical protein CSA21_02180 [Deltaproteobacteria bacterium]|nr:MAG: hypothetical protein CSA21_02180 [Deltaproteobacteria bacterium]
MKTYTVLQWVLTICFVLLGWVSPGLAVSQESSCSPAALAHALEVMFAQVDTEPPMFEDQDAVKTLVEVVMSQPGANQVPLPTKKRMVAAYYPFSVAISLDRFLRYAYNPDLPSYLVAPNSLRYGRWVKVDGEDKPLPRLWEYLGHLKKPVLVHGVEHEEITPDVFSGGYYSYESDRALILTGCKGRPVFISVARQQKQSDVGKKGAVVGRDADWQYLYSGIEGLTKGGLGWVSSYMYEAMSVTVFCEAATPHGLVLKAGIFKWIRAGWAGINMVRTHHIEEGCKRFATAMKEILETPDLPTATRMAEHLDWCEALSVNALQTLVKPYLDHIREVDDPVVKKSPFKKMLASGEYLATMPKEDMIKILVQGYLKDILHQESRVNMTACKGLTGQEAAAAE